jgi:hypothetical protein
MTDVALADSLTGGLNKLNDLASKEYDLDLNQLVEKAAYDETSLQRFTRLVGVALKEPFAKPYSIDPSVSATGAYRTWGLDETTFDSDRVKTLWQYSLLDELRTENWIPDARGYRPENVQQLAEDAMYERGFFWYLAKSAREYICDDKVLEKQLQAKVDEVQRHGGAAAIVSRDSLVAGAAMGLATAIIQAIPWLSAAAAPILTGLVIVVCTVGINGYCEWAADRLQDPEKVP